MTSGTTTIVIRRMKIVPAGSSQRVTRASGSTYRAAAPIAAPATSPARCADRGSSFAYAGEGYYQAADVTDLVRGQSKLAIGAILHWYRGGQGRAANAPGLLMKLVVEYADGSRRVVVTDGTWTTRRGPWGNNGARNGEGDVIETYDAPAAQAIGDWTAVGYDDSAWSPSVVVGAHPVAPFTTVAGLESRMTETVIKPKRILIADDGTPVADFGKVIPARPAVHFEEGVEGRVIQIRASYGLSETGRASARPRAISACCIAASASRAVRSPITKKGSPSAGGSAPRLSASAVSRPAAARAARGSGEHARGSSSARCVREPARASPRLPRCGLRQPELRPGDG